MNRSAFEISRQELLDFRKQYTEEVNKHLEFCFNYLNFCEPLVGQFGILQNVKPDHQRLTRDLNRRGVKLLTINKERT